MSNRTKVFVGFLAGFFLLLLALTFYSRAVYQRNLPRVETQMPVRSEYQENGRYLYWVSEKALQREPNRNQWFLYTAREYRDVLGERSLVTKIQVSVRKKEGGQVLVDGILREEPVLVEGFDAVTEGKAVLPVQ